MKLPKINLPPLDPKYKIAIVVGITFLGLTGYYDHLYKPHLKAVTALRDEVQSLNDRIAIVMKLEYPHVSRRTDIFRLMEEKKSALTKWIAQAERHLAAQADTSKLLETITSLANASGMNIKTLQPQAAQKTGDYLAMPLVLDVTAQFGHIVAFLQHIKNQPVVLSKMQISVRDRPQLAARLTVTIYMK